jgi:hypothetical protein
VARTLKKVQELRTKADQLSASTDPEVARIRTALQGIGQGLIKQLGDPELVKHWGFKFKKGSAAKQTALV